MKKNTQKEISKKKLIRLVGQGEGKNTKHILHMPEVRDELKRIMGDDRGEELFRALDRITKAADRLDWTMPPEVRGAHMEHGDQFGGAFDIEWE